MKTVVDSLWQTASFQPGDVVQTLRGSTSGVIVKILADGRVVWVPRGTDTELISLPESLRKVFIS
jgi:transcription elongation factor